MWQCNLSTRTAAYQSFFYKASESGEFAFLWKDDDGSVYESKHKLTVA